MALRTYIKSKVLISQDNSSTPQQVAFSTGDVEYIDSTTFNLESSKSLSLAPSAADHQVDMDSIVTAGIVAIVVPPNTGGPVPQVSVKLVPTGKVLANVSAYAIKPGIPMIIPCDIIEIYFSNGDALNSAKVIVASVGN